MACKSIPSLDIKCHAINSSFFLLHIPKKKIVEETDDEEKR